MGCISAFVCILAYNLNNTLCTHKMGTYGNRRVCVYASNVMHASMTNYQVQYPGKVSYLEMFGISTYFV